MNTPVPTPAPRWTTPIFWSTLSVHVIAGVSAFLALEGSGRDLSTLEALIPVVAIVASSMAHYVYAHRTTRAGVASVEHHVKTLTAEIERMQPALTKVAAIAEPLLQVADPKDAARVDHLVAGGRTIEAAARKP